MDKDLISRSVLLRIIRASKDLVTKLDAKELFDWVEAVIDVASSVDAAPKWISVQDRPPDMCGMPCLLYGINQYGQGRVFEGFAGYMRTGQLTWHATSAENDIAALNVSHWMPLPEPPEDENS